MKIKLIPEQKIIAHRMEALRWRSNNLERARANARKWIEKNKERYKQLQKDWRAAHPNYTPATKRIKKQTPGTLGLAYQRNEKLLNALMKEDGSK